MQDCLGFPYIGPKKSGIQNIQSKIAAIHLGGSTLNSDASSRHHFEKFPLHLQRTENIHLDGLLVIAGTFAIQNRLD